MTRAEMPIIRISRLGFLAGLFIGVAGLLSIWVRGTIESISPQSSPIVGKVTSAAVFPIGLILIVFTHSDLFTGSLLYCLSAFLSRKITYMGLLKCLSVSFLSNFAGAAFMAYLVFRSQLLFSEPFLTNCIRNGWTRATQTEWTTVFIKGIGAGLFVCIALFFSNSYNALTCKIVSIWWPIATFVALGLDHSIANMFSITTALLHVHLGSSELSFSSRDFLINNLIPCTLGNAIGAVVFVAVLNRLTQQSRKLIAIDTV